ncbi:MAG: cisplatin damage response ATP-dependent DNA ligase [Pseudomonadota bacterium]
MKLMTDYFAATPDPDRGWALAAITRDLDLKTVKPALLRGLAAERVDAELFALSYDYVGDLAETVSLIWPGRGSGGAPPSLSGVIERLSSASRAEAPAMMASLLDGMAPTERYALVKLATGGMRVGVSARLAKQALADYGAKDVTEIEELWHGLEPPYRDLFAWLDGGEKPVAAAEAPFRPVMLATPFEDRDRAARDPGDYVAEWKWDGIRVQAVAEGSTRRLYTRTGEDVSAAFPDLVAAMDFEGALDGELLVRPEGAEDGVGAFNDLQQRLNRKTAPAKLVASHPAFLRAYDLLVDEAEDLRPLGYAARRDRLAAFLAPLDPLRFDLSAEIAFADWDALDAMRSAPPHPAIEGAMMKLRDGPYVAGRPKGPWFKWKRDPHLIDAVLMYAQRGHGKRSSFYSDYTFGVWTEAGDLTPVGKAYFGFTDEELKEIDRYVRNNTVERYGPVRAVRAEPTHGLVFEVAFEGLSASTRHKSGVAMRFPRISRLRWDKPPAEADRIETLREMLG